MSYCVLHIFCVSRKGERVRGGDRWGHPQGAVWIAGARADCKGAMVDSR